MRTRGTGDRQRGLVEDRRALGKIEENWGTEGRPGRGQGASTETGEHRGSWQRPHKARDFEKNRENP